MKSAIHGIWAITLLMAATAPADTLWISSGGANAVQYDKARITGIQENQLHYVTRNGTDTTKEIADVARLAVPGETDLNTAEEAFAAEKWDQAVTAYQNTLRTSTGGAWIKDWVCIRLLDAAPKANRFDATITGYIALLLKNPKQVLQYKIAVPTTDPGNLTSAAGELSQALNEPRLTVEQQQALLTLLMDVHLVRKDKDAAGKVAEQLNKIVSANPNDPASAKMMGSLKLSMARLAISGKNYKKALQEIQEHRAIFTEPAQQADAFFYLAQAQEGLLTPQSDANAVKDVAIAYMRAVAAGNALADKPNVADALMRTAALQVRLGEIKPALQIYEEIANNFKGDPAAAQAAAERDRLKAKENSGQ